MSTASLPIERIDYNSALMQKDFAFEMAVSSVRVGVGVTREVGMDLKELGTKLAMVVTDPIVAKLPPVRTAIESLEQNGIANRRLKPTLGYLDPENTRTMPPAVAASTGLDILSHAIESLTAIRYTERPLPERPALRPAYQGSNPISDVWSMEALRLVSRYLVRAFDDPSDDAARANLLLAASYA